MKKKTKTMGNLRSGVELIKCGEGKNCWTEFSSNFEMWLRSHSSRKGLLSQFWTARLLCPWNSTGKNTEVDCYFILQGIFPTQWSNPGLSYCRQILYQGSPHRETENINMSVCMWMCECVREKETERDRETERNWGYCLMSSWRQGLPCSQWELHVCWLIYFL